MTPLSEYLEYYRKLEKPGYAVLVTGDWGVGKTWQVKETIPEENLWYVSLYGLSSVQEIHATVFATMYPALHKAKRLTEGIGNTAKEIGGVFGADKILPVASSFISDALSAISRQMIEPGEHILVFDDMERSKIVPDDLLGVINQYVELHGCRVVVIAHDKKLKRKLADRKEKIFGQTISVEPDIEAAAKHFTEQIEQDVKPEVLQFIEIRKDDILSVFCESGQNSLRILRHVIRDIGRLYDVTDAKFRKREKEMSEVVKLFSAFDIEVRRGRLTAKDIRNRPEISQQRTPILEASDQYESINLNNTLLGNEMLVEFLINGNYRRDLLSDSLGKSLLFSEPDELRPWRIVSNFDILSDEELRTGIDRLQQEFKDRTVTDSGEMLHMFAMQMWLIEEGEVSGSIKKVADEAINYIDDLLEQKFLPPRESEPNWKEDFEQRDDGRSFYWTTDATKPHLKRIQEHLIASRIEVHQQAFFDRIDEVLEQVKSDGDQFMEDFCFTGNLLGRYFSTPVLKEIPPDRFVKAWLEGHPSNRHKIKKTFGRRYKNGVPQGDLKDEALWIQEVIDKLNAAADAETGFAALRIKRLSMNILKI